MTYYDPEFKIQVQYMLERFLESELSAVDGKVIGIPFVVQNITKFFVR